MVGCGVGPLLALEAADGVVLGAAVAAIGVEIAVGDATAPMCSSVATGVFAAQPASSNADTPRPTNRLNIWSLLSRPSARHTGGSGPGA